MNDADGGIGALDAGLEQREVRGVAEPELVKPIGLGPADIARGGGARRIGILVMSNQRLPVFVSRPLHGFADLLPGVGHVSPLAWPRGPVGGAFAGAQLRRRTPRRPRRVPAPDDARLSLGRWRLPTPASADTTCATPRVPRRRDGGSGQSTRGGRGSECRRCR